MDKRWLGTRVLIMSALCITGFSPLGQGAVPSAGADDGPTVPPSYRDLAGGRSIIVDGPSVANAEQFLERLLRESGVTHDGWTLRPLDERSSPLGSHHRFRFEAAGLPLLGHSAALHTDPHGHIWYATQSVRAALPTAPVRPDDLITITEANALARSATASKNSEPGLPAHAVLGWQLAGQQLQAVWQVDLISPGHGEHVSDDRVWLDATTGSVLAAKDRLLEYQEGDALVFLPSPTVSAKDYDLADIPAGGPAPWIEAERMSVTLQGLSDAPNEHGTLTGQYATVNGDAHQPGLDFSYSRTAFEFQEVMAYHHTDRLQRYIQSLGFDDVNNESQLTSNANLFGTSPNAFYSPSSDSMTFISNSGPLANADAAEDAEVVVHENGHAIQFDQVPDWGDHRDQGSMGEGFSDYIAAASLADLTDGFGDACMGEWMGSHVRGTQFPLEGPTCYRYLDNDYTYSEIGNSGVHTAGQIWSGLLWDIWHTYDRDTSVRLALAGHFLMDGNSDMPEAVDMLIFADRALYDAAHETTIATYANEREIAGPLALWVLGLPGGDPDPYKPPGNETTFTYSVEEISVSTFDTSLWEEIQLFDDHTVEYDIPTTPFYGVNTTQLTVSSNGFVALGDYTGGFGCCRGGIIPEDDDVNGIIAGLWTDLDPSACDSRVAINITNEWVTIAYENISYYGQPCGHDGLVPINPPIRPPIVDPLFHDPREPTEATFSIRMAPKTGVIEIHLNAADGGIVATSGIENPDGTEGNQTRRTDANLTEPVAWRFTPLGAPVADPPTDPPIPEPEPEPFVVTREWTGRISCGVGTFGVGVAACALVGQFDDASVHEWTTNRSLSELVVGMRWNATNELDDELQLRVESELMSHPRTGTSPLIVHLPERDWLTNQGRVELRTRVFAGGTPGIVHDLPVELVVEEYHHQAAPEGRDPFEPLP